MTEDWVEWGGGRYDRAPVPDGTKVEVMFRGGGTDVASSEFWYWEHDDHWSDIVKYRIVSEVL